MIIYMAKIRRIKILYFHYYSKIVYTQNEYLEIIAYRKIVLIIHTALK